MVSIINQAFAAEQVPVLTMDRLWAAGWRHFGTEFFRYNVSFDQAEVRTITPLRLDLRRFVLSRSQRRVLRRNADLRLEIVPAELTAEVRAMFHRHKQRFRDNVPDDLETFLSPSPATVPCPCVELRAYAGTELVAASFLDIGRHATSAVYGVFEPAHGRRSLGTFTMLKEIEFSRQQGCRYYYLGYATREPGIYDYKKQFDALETFDWETGEWRPDAKLDGGLGNHSQHDLSKPDIQC